MNPMLDRQKDLIKSLQGSSVSRGSYERPQLLLSSQLSLEAAEPGVHLILTKATE